MDSDHRTIVEDLAWLLFQLKLNERARADKIITETMYIFAKESLQKNIDRIEKICYINI